MIHFFHSDHDLASMAPTSPRQIHVRFASELTVPPADRQRKGRSLYPKVAQEKGRSERQSSFDLFWQWETLTSVSRHQVKRRRYPIKGLATETESLEYATLLSVSGEVPPHTRRRKFFLVVQAFGLLVSHMPPANDRDTKHYEVLERSRGGLRTVSLGMEVCRCP